MPDEQDEQDAGTVLENEGEVVIEEPSQTKSWIMDMPDLPPLKEGQQVQFMIDGKGVISDPVPTGYVLKLRVEISGTLEPIQ